MATNPRLVDTSTKSVHQLSTGAKYLLASHSHLFPPSLDTQASSISPPLHLLLPPPLTHNEQYCVQLEVDDEGSCLVRVWVGECSVDKKIVATKSNQVSLSHESLMKLGKDMVLQYIMTNSEGLPRRRVLPQTPGQQLTVAPPSKPTRTQPLVRVQPLFLPFHTGPCTTIQLFPCMQSVYSVCTSGFLSFCSHCRRGMRLWQMETAVRCLLRNPSTQG
jgi:hypothetical protein